MKIFVTGASGFIGQALISKLISEQHCIKALVRRSTGDLYPKVDRIVVNDLADLTSIENCSLSVKDLKDIDIVVHTAALVHQSHNGVINPTTKYRKINYDATLALARMAAAAGVRRFIFLSSIKVNGELTQPGQPFEPDDIPAPADPYGLSKFEAEQGLLDLTNKVEMDVVIIRPPLVYGPGVKGNFSSLVKWIRKPVILPFGAINNRRSLIALDNLVDFILLCIDLEKSKKASNQVFLICDGEDVSTTELLKKVGKAQSLYSRFGAKAWLLPFPVSLMNVFAKLFNKKDLANRLFGTMQIDPSKANELLGWEPLVKMDEQLNKMFDKN